MRVGLPGTLFLTLLSLSSCYEGTVAPAPAAAEPRKGPLKVGDRFADYSVKVLNGGSWTPVTAGKKVTLVNVWATWCVPCREETPEFVKLHERYSPRGMEVVGISIDASNHEGKVREFVKEFKVPYTMAHDAEAGIANLFQVPALPFTILLDASGKVMWVYPGSLTADDSVLVEKIESTLGS